MTECKHPIEALELRIESTKLWQCTLCNGYGSPEFFGLTSGAFVPIKGFVADYNLPLPHSTFHVQRMALCEQNHLVLRPGIMYLFEARPDCEKCAKIANTYED